MIGKYELTSVVDNRFHYLLDGKIKVNYVDAKSLISENRIDICVKYQYLNAIINEWDSIDYYRDMYKSTIYYFSDGVFYEPGESNKKSFDDFELEFKNLYSTIKENGFNESKGYIPLSKNGIPLDGAHRIAVAAILDLTIPVLYLDTEDNIFDYAFFKKKGAIDIELRSYLQCLYEIDVNLRVAIIWPYCSVDENLISDIYGESLIAVHEYNLNLNGVRNLCLLSYHNESWAGNERNSWSGIPNKADDCYRNKPTKVYYFRTNGLNNDTKIKEKVRSLADGSKNNIHSTDTYEETKDITDVLLSQDGLLFLNSLNIKKVAKIKRAIIDSINKMNKVIVTSSAVLS
ncbi:hypothetical protein, partial [Photobacterium kishitanii]|uniref:hypothetical protein n=1 Tax=Photobacterium kishitanii TaxID=318456 RepID=UPI000D3FA5CE